MKTSYRVEYFPDINDFAVFARTGKEDRCVERFGADEAAAEAHCEWLKQQQRARSRPGALPVASPISPALRDFIKGGA